MFFNNGILLNAESPGCFTSFSPGDSYCKVRYMRSKQKFMDRGQPAALNRAKQRCRGIVASAGACESCEEVPGIAQHHGVFRGDQRAKLNPLLLLDPELEFWLCTDCHTANADAPHVDNDAFLAKMIAKERWA